MSIFSDAPSASATGHDAFSLLNLSHRTNPALPWQSDSQRLRFAQLYPIMKGTTLFWPIQVLHYSFRQCLIALIQHLKLPMTLSKPDGLSIHKLSSTLRSGTVPLVTFAMPPALAAGHIATGFSPAAVGTAALRRRRQAAGRAG
jgi:hypothetical protein